MASRPVQKLRTSSARLPLALLAAAYAARCTYMIAQVQQHFWDRVPISGVNMTLEVLIPCEVMTKGFNVLQFLPAKTFRPIDVGLNEDRRQLWAKAKSIHFEWLSLDDATETLD